VADRRVVLASASPRRHELLRELDIEFDVVIPGVDEDAIAAGLAPIEAVTALAAAKLAATRGLIEPGPPSIVIACDTMVVGPDGTPVGKPTDREDARRLLASFSNSTITVVSGLAVAGHEAPGGTIEAVQTKVRLRTISANEVADYVATGAADDKAGGLELQDRAGPFIVEVNGCWTNVVGLPVCRVRRLIGSVINASGADVEADTCPTCDCRTGPDMTAVGVDDLLDDREAEPGPGR